MSVIHNILTPKKALDISMLNEFVSTIDNAVVQDRGEGTYYYWTAGKSTRGFDITLNGDVIEIRNTVLSNKHDYHLTNKVVEKILKLTNGLLINQDQEQVVTRPLFSDQKIVDAEINDCQLIQTLAKENEDIAIYGPTRTVHFGKRLYETLKRYSGKELCAIIFDIILKVNYQIPDYDYGNVMHVGNNEGQKKIMKVLTNEADCMVDKYDYILLHTPDEQPIMITNEILNTMLPPNWTLVDEFTVVAPITSPAEWEKLLNTANQYDLFDTFTP